MGWAREALVRGPAAARRAWATRREARDEAGIITAEFLLWTAGIVLGVPAVIFIVIESFKAFAGGIHW